MWYHEEMKNPRKKELQDVISEAADKVDALKVSDPQKYASLEHLMTTPLYDSEKMNRPA